MHKWIWPYNRRPVLNYIKSEQLADNNFNIYESMLKFIKTSKDSLIQFWQELYS